MGVGPHESVRLMSPFSGCCLAFEVCCEGVQKEKNSFGSSAYN